MDVDPFSLVEDPPNLKTGTLLQSPDGTFVLVSTNENLSEYGAYMIGNRITDPRVPKNLHKLDAQKVYQEGECDSVAFALYEQSDEFVAVDEIMASDGTMWHSIARHKDGYCVDSLGVWDEQDLLDYWDSIRIREGEHDFSLNKNVQAQGRKPNFQPTETLQPLVDYLNTLAS